MEVTSVIRAYASVQLVPALIAHRWLVVAAIVLVTALFGRRVYCRCICPLGVAQSLVRLWRGSRRICSRLDHANWRRPCDIVLRGLLVLVFLALGVGGLGWQWLDPYAIVARAVAFWYSPDREVALAVVMLAPALTILVLALVSHGRAWCNHICPVGSILSLIGIRPWRGDAMKKCAGCQRCGRCVK